MVPVQNSIFILATHSWEIKSTKNIIYNDEKYLEFWLTYKKMPARMVHQKLQAIADLENV
jgi:hypothetical protein